MNAQEIISDLMGQAYQCQLSGPFCYLRIWLSEDDYLTLRRELTGYEGTLIEDEPLRLLGHELRVEGDFLPMVEVVDPVEQFIDTLGLATIQITKSMHAFQVSILNMSKQVQALTESLR